jgi:probable F420-dependent oxidoreductase
MIRAGLGPAQMRFGVCLPIHGALPGGTPIEYLRKTLGIMEASTIESVWIEDHFRLPPNEIEASEGKTRVDEPLEAWTTLAAMAAISSRVRLGTEVTPMTIRHPGVLAKLAANVDVLSHGRLILGAGAGWNRTEFVSQGIPFEPLEERFAKVKEALEVVKLLWTSDRIDFDGRFYRLKDAYLAPKPVSKPHPPIWLGGFSDRILALVAEFGDGWINATNAPPDDVEAERKRLVGMLEVRGRKLSEVSVAVPLMSIVRRKEEEAKEEAKQYMERGKFDKTLRFFADTVNFGLVGTPAQCIEKIKRYSSAGVTHVIFDIRPPSNVLPTLELLCTEVVPAFA